jgi:sporulation protein YlmC with PRC-barrel domain
MNQVRKNTVLTLATFTLLGITMLSLPVIAQNMTQTIEMVHVDVVKLSTGYRISKIIGKYVVNDTDQIIGKVDDVIVNPDDDSSTYVILSVGGWLSMGTHLIALPYKNLQITANKIVLPGATKEGLKNLPEFKYSTP